MVLKGSHEWSISTIAYVYGTFDSKLWDGSEASGLLKTCHTLSLRKILSEIRITDLVLVVGVDDSFTALAQDRSHLLEDRL